MKTALFIFELVGSLAVWPFLYGYVMYRISVKGSHRRYIARNILRPTLYIIPVYFAVRVIETYLDHNWLLFVCDLYNTYWTSKFFKEFHDSDEDDWWTKTGKRLKRWAKAKAQALKPQVLVPIPVGAR